MLRTNYVLRLIEEAMRAVTRAKQQREAGEDEGARDTLDRALEDLLGLSLAQILSMPVIGLLTLLGGAVQMDVPRALTVARLLLERGLVAAKVADKLACHRRAFCLYDEVTRAAPEHPALAEHEGCISQLLDSLEILSPPLEAACGV